MNQQESTPKVEGSARDRGNRLGAVIVTCPAGIS